MSYVWATKHRPTSFEDYIFQNEVQKQKLLEYAKTKEIPNLLLSGVRGTGKAQPLDAKILTPTGWVTMGNIKVGDEVLTPKGTKSKVTYIHPQGMKQVYDVKLHDGSKTEACLDHLWECYYMSGRTPKHATKHIETTSSVIKFLERQSKRTSPLNISIPIINQNIEFDIKIPLTIPPYLLGVLLGDGCISGGSITITSMDLEIVDRCISCLDQDYHLTVSNNAQLKAPSYRVVPKTRTGKPNRYISLLREMNLYGTYSHDKFIPEQYKYASVHERLELIQGLMDTDGTVDKRGGVSFSTASVILAKDMQHILWSLGAVCTITTKQSYFTNKTNQRTEGLLSYTLFIAYNDSKQLFGISRKRDRCNSSFAMRTNKKQPTLRRRIRSIEPSRITQAQCITIDDADQLYITDDFIVTHNSTYAKLITDAVVDPDNRSNDVMKINASKDNGVDFVREKICNFIETFSMGQYKIILLEEADYLSHQAQAMLRSLTEEYTESIRFIITCNYPNKLTPELRSRFTRYDFESMKFEDVMMYLADILQKEKVVPDINVMEKCVDIAYPDLRQIITIMQSCVVDGRLVNQDMATNSLWKEDVLECIKNSRFDALSDIVNTNIPDNEFENFYDLVHENIHLCPSFKKGSFNYGLAIINIADYLFKNASFAKQHINANGFVFQLKHIAGAK